MKKLLLAAATALLAFALPARAQTTSVAIPTPSGTQGVLAVVAIMGQGTTCTIAAPCIFPWTDTFANWQRVGVWIAPICQSRNLVGSPPVPTVCSGSQDFGTAAWVMINGIIQNANAAAVQAGTAAAIAVTPLPTPANPAIPVGIPNCGGAC
jgi:hypothetical protein